MSENATEATAGSTAEDQNASEAPDRLRRKIAITLATLVVLGAGIGILQVDASARESNSARDTTRTAVKAMRANVVADMVSGLVPQFQAERDFLPFRRPLTEETPSLSGAADTPSAQGSTAGSLRIAQRAVPDLAVGDLLERLQIDAQRLTLKQRTLATTRITWNDRSTQYTTVVAVLAVALFLVGFGLIAEGPIRRSAYTLGLAVGIFAAGWAVWIYLLPIPTTPDAAIDATAQGAALTAKGDYRGALAKFDAALRTDDSFAPAYAGRSRARLLAANPDYPVTRAVTDVSGRATAGAVSDARRAAELNDRDVVSFALLALTSFFRGDYARAIEATDQALAINAKVPDLWLLKSAAQVALDDPRGANSSLDHALALLRGTEPSQQTRLLASTSLSYLAWVERYVPRDAGAARALADRIVSIETRFTLGRTLPKRPPATGSASVEDLRYSRREAGPTTSMEQSPGRHGAQRARLRASPQGRCMDAARPTRPLRDRRRNRRAQPSDSAATRLQTDAGTRRRLPERRTHTPPHRSRRLPHLLTRGPQRGSVMRWSRASAARLDARLSRFWLYRCTGNEMSRRLEMPPRRFSPVLRARTNITSNCCVRETGNPASALNCIVAQPPASVAASPGVVN